MHWCLKFAICLSKSCYNGLPGVNLTFDEQLFSTKVHCRFTQYMPNKHDKFGIKFWLACDINIKYIVNVFPYFGKRQDKRSEDSTFRKHRFASNRLPMEFW